MSARHDRSREGAAMGEENMAAKSPGHHREGGKASQHACAGRRIGICRTGEIVP